MFPFSSYIRFCWFNRILSHFTFIYFFLSSISSSSHVSVAFNNRTTIPKYFFHYIRTDNYYLPIYSCLDASSFFVICISFHISIEKKACSYIFVFMIYLWSYFVFSSPPVQIFFSLLFPLCSSAIVKEHLFTFAFIANLWSNSVLPSAWFYLSFCPLLSLPPLFVVVELFYSTAEADKGKLKQIQTLKALVALPRKWHKGRGELSKNLGRIHTGRNECRWRKAAPECERERKEIMHEGDRQHRPRKGRRRGGLYHVQKVTQRGNGDRRQERKEHHEGTFVTDDTRGGREFKG